MNADRLNDLKADLRHVPAWRAMAMHVKPEASNKVIEAIARVVIEACAEIAERDSVLDWAGGSTGNAIGTQKLIVRQIRALLDLDTAPSVPRQDEPTG